MNRTCEYNQGFWKVGGIVRVECRKFKKCYKKCLGLLEKIQVYQKEIL